MPKNNNLKPKKFPMPIKFGKKPTTEFVNSLQNINVTLVNPQNYDELKKNCIPFSNATWEDYNPLRIMSRLTEKQEDLLMYHIFSKKILPTTMETIRLNFLIEGISLVDVTHILRYRRAVFSAECTGDKFLNDKNYVVPTSVENSPEFYERYKKICLDAKQLYCDMVDSKEVNIHDARQIIPRSMDTFYFMSMSLSDALTFIYDRVDKQIQPQADNVIAYGMMKELVKAYPILAKILNSKIVHRRADFYVKTARQNRSTNWYCPDNDSDCFEYNERDFVYGMKKRDEFLGTGENKKDVFTEIMDNTCEFLDGWERYIDFKYGEGFFEQEIDF